MAAYELLLLNTAVPQIQAAQAGDTYVVPRDIAFSTVANLANGTYLLPSLTFSSDTDTGIFRQGANQLGFTAGGGLDQMVLTSTGLGIGTSSPGAKLDVADATQATGAIMRLTNSASSSAWVAGDVIGQIDFYSTDASLAGTKAQIKSFADTGTSSVGINYSALSFSTMLNGIFAERMRLDSSGNLGLGVTPSAWGSPFVALQVSRAGLRGSFAATGLSFNTYYDGTNFRYIASGLTALDYYQNSGQHVWQIAPSGTAGNAISFTQAMTLDASGNLGIGTTNPSSIGGSITTVNVSGAAGGGVRFQRTSATATNGYIAALSGEFRVATADTNPLTFFTNNSERARITSGGYFKASDNGTYVGSTGSYHEFTQTGSATTLYARNSVASGPFGLELLFSAASPDDNTQWFLKASDSTTTRCYIWSDGDLANHDGVYGTISDQKLKQDIIDAGSQWNDLKAIRFRKYRMKSDVAANPDAPYLLGVVAQELEQVSPGLVDEHPDADGEVTKTVKSSILLMKAAVALQEAMARIETLEAKVAQLEGN